MKADGVVGSGFSGFGTQHLCVLALTAGLVTLLSWVARSGRYPRFEKGQTLALAVLMLSIHPLTLMAATISGIPIGAGNVLPMHLCDWAALVGFFALVWKRPFFCELTYFWGLGATLQGLLTPDLHYGFPHPVFFVFFLHHAGVVLVALYVPIGLRMIPRRHSVWKVFLATQVYVAAAMATNFLLKTNYGFLSEKPSSASLMDHMGPWPWYLFSLEIVCLATLLLCDAPFAILRWYRRVARASCA